MEENNEVYLHCVVVGSNYTKRQRIGIHYLFNDTNFNDVMDKVSDLLHQRGVSVYFVKTNSPLKSSLQEQDPFFESMEIYESHESDAYKLFDINIKNQVSIEDVVLLILTFGNLPYETIQTYIVLFYILYCYKYEVAPFSEKIRFEEDDLFFYEIKRGFENIGMEYKEYKVKNREIVLSKYMNIDDGIERMNEYIRLINVIKSLPIDKINDFITFYSRELFNSFKTEITLSRKQKNKSIQPKMIIDSTKLITISPYLNEMINN